jgi:hypothetical protein
MKIERPSSALTFNYGYNKKKVSDATLSMTAFLLPSPAFKKTQASSKSTSHGNRT